MTALRIESFHDEYRFLSNFFPVSVRYEGITFPTVEHAYQAAKTVDEAERWKFAELKSPGQAKRRGRKTAIRADWESVKVQVMSELVRQKFFRHEELAEMLLATEEAELVEGNTWGDRFWGVCEGVGQNWLGRILMTVRGELRERLAHV